MMFFSSRSFFHILKKEHFHLQDLTKTLINRGYAEQIMVKVCGNEKITEKGPWKI